MRRTLIELATLAFASAVLSACNGKGSGEAGFSSSNDPNDTIRQIKAEEARMEGQLEAGRREAEGSWGQTDPGYQTPEQMGFQPR